MNFKVGDKVMISSLAVLEMSDEDDPVDYGLDDWAKAVGRFGQVIEVWKLYNWDDDVEAEMIEVALDVPIEVSYGPPIEVVPCLSSELIPQRGKKKWN